MASYDQLKQRLDNGEVVILDGAIGTELQRMGVPMDQDAWCAVAMETHPDTVRQLHEYYIRAGAEIITTNTFMASRHALEAAGREDKTEEWNRKAAELTVQARDAVAQGPVWIAGSIFGFGPWGEVDQSQMRKNFAEQASILAEYGSDLILLEMLGSDAEMTKAAIEESSKAGLPVWVALTCVSEDGSTEIGLGTRRSSPEAGRRQGEETFGESAARIKEVGGDAFFVFHSRVEISQPAVQELREHLDGPIGAYPHSGHWVQPNWQFVNRITPEAYLEEANQWVSQGAQIVGGCCGIGLQHMELLRHGLEKRAPSRV